MSNNVGLTTLDSALEKVEVVAGTISIGHNPQLATLGSVLQRVTGTVASIDNNDDALPTLGSALENVVTVTGQIFIARNNLLTTLGTAFSSLQSCRSVSFDGTVDHNGHGQSARPAQLAAGRSAPARAPSSATTSYVGGGLNVDDADHCC